MPLLIPSYRTQCYACDDIRSIMECLVFSVHGWDVVGMLRETKVTKGKVKE